MILLTDSSAGYDAEVEVRKEGLEDISDVSEKATYHSGPFDGIFMAALGEQMLWGNFLALISRKNIMRSKYTYISSVRLSRLQDYL